MKYSEKEVIIPELEAKLGQRNYNYWTSRDEAILTRYYGKVPTKDLAKTLGRSISSVSKKAHDMGLRKARE